MHFNHSQSHARKRVYAGVSSTTSSSSGGDGSSLTEECDEPTLRRDCRFFNQAAPSKMKARPKNIPKTVPTINSVSSSESGSAVAGKIEKLSFYHKLFFILSQALLRETNLN